MNPNLHEQYKPSATDGWLLRLDDSNQPCKVYETACEQLTVDLGKGERVYFLANLQKLHTRHPLRVMMADTAVEVPRPGPLRCAKLVVIAWQRPDLLLSVVGTVEEITGWTAALRRAMANDHMTAKGA